MCRVVPPLSIRTASLGVDRYEPSFYTHRNRGPDEPRPASQCCSRPNTASNPKPSSCAAPTPTGAASFSSLASVRPPPNGALEGTCTRGPDRARSSPCAPAPRAQPPGPRLLRPPWSRPRRVGLRQQHQHPQLRVSGERSARAGATGLSERGSWFPGSPGGVGTPSPQMGPYTAGGGGAVTQACQSVLLGARWEFPAEVVPLSGGSSSAKADGPFHRHLPTPVPGWILGFHGKVWASVGRGGHPRRGRLCLHTAALGASSHGIVCLCAQVAGGPRCAHTAPAGPGSPSPSSPPSPFLCLSLFSRLPSRLPPFFPAGVLVPFLPPT